MRMPKDEPASIYVLYLSRLLVAQSAAEAKP